MWWSSNPATWTFDIDRYLNPFIPHPPWRWIPYPIAYFLGHRKHPQKSVGNLVIIFWALIGIFVGLLVIALVTKHVPVFQNHDAPIIVASFVSVLSRTIDLNEEGANKTTGPGSGGCVELLRHRFAVGPATEYRCEPGHLQRHRCRHP